MSGMKSIYVWRDLVSLIYVWRFLAETLDSPEKRFVKNAFDELQYVGALDHGGYITHLGALLVHLPLSPTLGAAALTQLGPELRLV